MHWLKYKLYGLDKLHSIHNMRINTCFIIDKTNFEFAFTAKQRGPIYVSSLNTISVLKHSVHFFIFDDVYIHLTNLWKKENQRIFTKYMMNTKVWVSLN